MSTHPVNRAPQELLWQLWTQISEAEERLDRLSTRCAEGLNEDAQAALSHLRAAHRLVLRRLEADAGGATQPASGPAPRDDGRFRVLLVEDDCATREAAREILDAAFAVVAVPDGRAGLAAWEAHGADVVVTDLCMPGMDGLQLTRAIRQTAHGKSVPVIMLSAVHHPATKVRAFEEGTFDYVVKPVDPGELVARVRNSLVWSEHLKQEQYLQEVDELTGVGNRRRMSAFLSERLRRCRWTQTPLSVVMVDLDRLKHLNDTWGHAAGDRALKALAEVLSRVTRASDLVARTGGDEFVVVLPEVTRAGAEAVVHRAHEELARHPPLGPGVRLSASFGVAASTDVMGDATGAQTPEALLERADQALYRHKRGRNVLVPESGGIPRLREA